MTITEFLESRIAEDEKQASALLRDLEDQISEEYVGVVEVRGPMTSTRLLSAQMWAHYDGQSKRRSFAKGQQIATLANPRRVLAECAAKRAIIADRERIDRSVSPDDWSMGYSDANYDAIKALAAVYADHPDYLQEWAE